MYGHILAIAVSHRGVQRTTGPRRFGKPSEHRAEVVTRDVNEGGTGPDAFVWRARTLRVSQVIRQRVQQVGHKSALAKQFDETY